MSELETVSLNGSDPVPVSTVDGPIERSHPYGPPGTFDVHFGWDEQAKLWTGEPAKVVTGLTGRTKVALVGFSEAAKVGCPWDDESWEIVSLNQHYRHQRRASRWFEIHTREQYLSDTVPNTDYLKWLQTTPLPIYVTEVHPDMPTAIQMPMNQVLDLGACVWEEDRGQWRRRDYNQSSLAAMLGWALVEGFDTIGIWGVDLIIGTEYCLAPETRVLTGDLRWVEIAKVAEGDQLAAFDESPPAGRRRAVRSWRTATVERATRLRRPCYRLVLDDGTTVVASAEHRWLVQADGLRWRTTEQMARSIGHRNSNIRLLRLADVWEEDRSWEAGYLAATFDGDGTLRNTKRPGRTGSWVTHMSFGQKPNAMSHEATLALAALGFKHSVIKGRACDNYVLQGGRPEILRFLGQVRPRRLLDKFSADRLGRLHAKTNPRVVSVEYVGEQDVIGLGTSTGTLVAEGLASHNSYQKCNMEWLIGFAQGRGYTVTRGTKPRGIPRELFLPEASALLHQTYSYGPQTAGDNPLRPIMVDRQQAIGNGQKELVDTLNKIDGELFGNYQWIRLLESHARGETVKWTNADGTIRDVPPDPGIWLDLLRERQQHALKAKEQFVEQYQQAEGEYRDVTNWLSILEFQDRGARPKWRFVDGREEFIKLPRR